MFPCNALSSLHPNRKADIIEEEESKWVCCLVQADAKTIVIMQFRTDFKLPSKAIIFNVMRHYGSLNMQDDIWFNTKKFLVYVQFQHEQDALTAQSVLERRASSLFNLPEVWALCTTGTANPQFMHMVWHVWQSWLVGNSACLI